MKKVYLLSTEHLEDSLWFRNDEDFKVGMNYVAVQAAECPHVDVYSFVLMSNHVHFVLYGEKESVTNFVNRFKHRYSMHLNHKYGTGSFLRRNPVHAEVLPSEDEAVEKGIAYVHMNPVAANICAHASQYPWGSGNSIFLPSPAKGTPFGSLSLRAKRRLFHSHCRDIPNDWIVGADGYIPQTPGVREKLTGIPGPDHSCRPAGPVPEFIPKRYIPRVNTCRTIRVGTTINI